MQLSIMTQWHEITGGGAGGSSMQRFSLLSHVRALFNMTKSGTNAIYTFAGIDGTGNSGWRSSALLTLGSRSGLGGASDMGGLPADAVYTGNEGINFYYTSESYGDFMANGAEYVAASSSVEDVEDEDLFESMWNSPLARYLVPDKISVSMGGDLIAFFGVGTQPVNFSILTRGKEPGLYLTPTFNVNAGYGASASGGFNLGISYYTGDPRNISSNMLQGKSYGAMATGGFLGDLSIGGSYSPAGDNHGFINGSIGVGIGFGLFGGYQYQYTPGSGKLWGW